MFDGQETHIVRASKEDKILKWLVKYDSNLLLFHHRRPTSTVNVKRAAHPFSTKDYFDKGKTQYVLAHNGHISNSQALYREHTKLGIKYQSYLQDRTFNDSEALLWDFALYMEGEQEELKAQGGIAFICVKLTKGKLDKLYFGRNTNPLNMYRDKDGIELSSEGRGEPIDDQQLYTWNYKLKRLTNKTITIPRYQWEPYETETKSAPTYKPATPLYGGDYDRNRPSSKLGKKIGDWVSPSLRKKFKLEEQASSKLEQTVLGQESQYIYDASGKLLILPKGVDYPSKQEVQREYMSYLMSAAGHFEKAYWSLEVDYEIAEAAEDLPANIRKRILLEQVMEFLENDPEYSSQDAVSSIWEAAWTRARAI